MGWLCMAAAECSYEEIGRQLKEQFIHSLNDKSMLDIIIRESTSRNGNVQTTSEDVLAWAKRVKAQRAQASVLNDITETKAFDKVNKERGSKYLGKRSTCCNTTKMAMQILWGKSCTKAMPGIWENVCSMQQDKHFRKVCRSKRNHTVHEVEIDMEPESQGEDTEVVSINSLYINRKRLLIMAKLEMQVGKTALEIPYKIDMGSEGNLMPLYIF